MKKYFYIYLILNTLNGKRYIGKRASNKPPMEDEYMGSGYALKDAQRKYGMENFEKFILEECESEDAAYKREELYITVLDAVKDSNYYNITGGGRGTGSGENHPMYGKKHSEETRKKIGDASKGKKHSEETRKKLSDALRGENHPMYGKTLSEETRKKMSDAHKGEKNHNYGKTWTLSEETRKKISDASKGEKNHFYGKKHSEETRKKISDARKGIYKEENHPMYGKKHSEETRKKLSNSRKNKKQVVQLDKSNLECLNIFESVCAAARYIGKDKRGISKVCNGKTKTAYGYKWMFAEDYIKQYGEIPQELKVV